MRLLPDGGEPVLTRVAPAIDIHGVISLFLQKDDFGMRIVINVANERIASAEALDGSLEENLPCRGFVGIEMANARSMVVGVVADDKYLAFAVKVEISKGGVTVL